MEMLELNIMKSISYTKPDKNFWKNKSVLVTGHNGFKGSWLSLWLLNMNAQVSGLSLENEQHNNLFDQLKIKNNLNHIICDIRDKDALKNNIQKIKPDIIFHLAAQSLVIQSYKDPIYTWETNVLGSLNILDALSSVKKNCLGIFITTDKVYKNNEWIYGYRENDELGGYDPYSSSKAACEIAIASWRSSFLSNKEEYYSRVSIASARSGNVIGGGDWAENRIIPDLVRSLQNKEKIIIRNPLSTRPWQHVLEPLSGYLILAEKLEKDENKLSTAFNFGPFGESNRTVKELVEECMIHWNGEYTISEDLNKPYESRMLNLSIEKAINYLNWRPKWNFNETIEKTINWYKSVYDSKKSPLECSLNNLNEYMEE